MLKIDIHTHIIPREIPDFKLQFGYEGFIKTKNIGCNCANLVYDNGKFFRKIESNCWDPVVRIKEFQKNNINIQVLSTVPVLFNYWAKPHDALITSKYNRSSPTTIQL